MWNSKAMYNISTLLLNFCLSILVILTIGACTDREDDNMGNLDDTEFTSGIFIINQGIADSTESSGTISFYNPSTDHVTDSIYFKATGGFDIGKGLKDLDFVNGRGYLTLSEEQKIIVVDERSFSFLGNINGFEQASSFLAVSNTRAYVSDWGADGATGSVKVVDLSTNNIVKSIAVAGGPGKMLKKGKDIYVVNSGGIFVDSIVTKISTETDAVVKTIEVGKVPNGLTLDKDGNIWVLSQGLISQPGNPQPGNSQNGKLVKIENDEVVFEVDVFPGASSLTINRESDRLYYIMNGWVYAQEISANSIPLVPFIDRSFTSLAVDPLTGQLHAADAKNLVDNGEMLFFDPLEGDELKAVEVGLVPIGFVFK